MKPAAIAAMIFLLGLANTACVDTSPPTSGNYSPGSFTGDLNHLGGAPAPVQGN